MPIFSLRGQKKTKFLSKLIFLNNDGVEIITLGSGTSIIASDGVSFTLFLTGWTHVWSTYHSVTLM